MKLKVSVCLSILIHVVFFSWTLFINEQKGGRKGTGNGNSNQGASAKGNKKGSDLQGMENANVIPKERPVDVSLIEKPEEKPELVLKKEKQKKKRISADKECPGAWYGGIGIQTGINEEILEVFPGYPADLAGLQKGDIISFIDSQQILGEPGTKISLIVNRKGQFINFQITRDKICYTR